MTLLLLLLAGAIPLTYLGLRRFELSRAYRPSRGWVTDDPVPGHPPETLWLRTPDGVRLHAWFFVARPDSPRRSQVLCLFHGNAGNLSHRGEFLALLLETGLNLLAIDYRGYGRSEGTPGEEGTYRDAETAHGWLTARGFAPGDILVHGESLGGGIASHLALARPVGGLILQSSFTSLPDVASELFPYLPVRTVGALRYPTRERLGSIHVPLLILHSRTDELIPFRHAERNFAAAHEPKLLWELRAGHTDYLARDRANLQAGIRTFLEAHFPTSGGRS
ncbi:MAG TPA: alpha/beta hydrolase [Verrucomicrobiales bacterium]|nr:alpha/beta hydrolase [Verrucomicrobiales bacterium]